jgi:hypothetical protein
VAFLCTKAHVTVAPSARPLADARVAGARVPASLVCKVCSSPGIRVSNATKQGVGYHYSTAHAWEAIQREGLVPYKMGRTAREGRDEFLKMTGGQMGVYLWAQPFFGGAHAGSILERCIAHQTWRVVRLRVTFPLSHVIPLPMIPLHSGVFQSADPNDPVWTYHDREPAILLSRTVQPERIKLVGDYDLVALLARA